MSDDEARDDPMLSGWDLVRHRATEALERGHREFERSEHAASRSDFQVEELLNADLLRAATPADVPARFREATADVERVRDDMTTHPAAYGQVIDALTLLGRWLAADPEDPAGQAVARAVAGPPTDTPWRGPMSEIRPQGDEWADLIAALTLLRKGADEDNASPLHCEHDTLWVMAVPEKFAPEEIAQLDEWGFFAASEGGFKSFRYGSA